MVPLILSCLSFLLKASGKLKYSLTCSITTVTDMCVVYLHCTWFKYVQNGFFVCVFFFFYWPLLRTFWKNIMEHPQLCPFPYFRKYWIAETALAFARRARNYKEIYNNRIRS